MPSLLEHAGGEDAIHRLEDIFYAKVLADPLLQPLFGHGQPQHVDHLTAFTVESFGGPTRFTEALGFAHLIVVHRHSCIRCARYRAGAGPATTCVSRSVGASCSPRHVVPSPPVNVNCG